jgi:hydroxypyruvate reductase 1
MGNLLWRKTVGVIGAGRIGSAYAHMMVQGHKMNLIYYDVYPNADLENDITRYNAFLAAQGEAPVSCKRAETVEELLQEADCVSIHTILDDTTHHLINAERLALMKADAIIVNTSRGPVIDEAALVAHCQNNPDFKAGLDVFEDEPEMKPGMVDLDNVVIVPHIASATSWTRQGMATLAAANVAGILQGYPAWQRPDIMPFLEGDSPKAAPSILNADALGIPAYKD